MTVDITVRHLIDLPDALPVLTRWFVDEWEPYYGLEGPGDAEADLRAAKTKNGLPTCLVAIDNAGDVVGTAALKAESVASHGHLTPWLAAVLVAAEHRRQGVGTALIAAIEDEARRLGFDRLYVATDTAIGIIERRGWVKSDEAETLRGTVGVYSKEL
jgi:GNAT superfamily N-acetyltransferase